MSMRRYAYFLMFGIACLVIVLSALFLSEKLIYRDKINTISILVQINISLICLNHERNSSINRENQGK